jgi:hypothetical protein
MLTPARYRNIMEDLGMSILAALEQAVTNEKLQNTTATITDNSGIKVFIKASENANWGSRYVVEVASGYRAGSILSMGNTEIPQHFPTIEIAIKWLKETGYTIIDMPMTGARILAIQPRTVWAAAVSAVNVMLATSREKP